MSQVLFTVDIDLCTITTHVVVMETVAPSEYFTHYCYLRNFGQYGSLCGGIGQKRGQVSVIRRALIAVLVAKRYL